MKQAMRAFLLLFLFSCCLNIICSAQEKAVLYISDTGKTMISKHIYGQFAEHLGRSVYDGFYRNGKIRMDIVSALKEIKVPNLRWPGGCFADQYHWREGIGEIGKRPQTVNTTWGMVAEDNSFGTDEFMRLCKLIGCEPYIAGNVGTGSPQEMKDWIEYLNFSGASTLTGLRAASGHPAPYQVSLWGVGNESWGCGGNMTPEYYAGLYKHFASFCPDYPGAPLKKIISGANADDYHWTEVMMKDIGPDNAWGLSLHYYTFPTGKWNPRGSATRFTEHEYAQTLAEALKMETIINKHEAIMNKYDPKKKMALLVDEWGVWTDVEPGTKSYAMYQQNSLRDALIAATTLNIFNNHADRIKEANLAQAVNVIQSLILTKGDQMLLTPTYYVFDLYQVHQDGSLLSIKINSPKYQIGKDKVNAVNASASRDGKGITHISLVNLDPHQMVSIASKLPAETGEVVTGQILTSAKFTDVNTFEQPDKVQVKAFSDAKITGQTLNLNLPPLSMVMLTIKNR
ncbi:MAG: alpha-L-arabinofuranosidase C-terminal domain-containing protein [Bacteroidota bacterium]